MIAQDPVVEQTPLGFKTTYEISVSPSSRSRAFWCAPTLLDIELLNTNSEDLNQNITMHDGATFVARGPEVLLDMPCYAVTMPPEISHYSIHILTKEKTVFDIKKYTYPNERTPQLVFVGKKSLVPF